MAQIESIAFDGDLLLKNGTTYVVRGAECATQRIEISLDIFLGEYFLNRKVGVPYHRDILIHSPNPEVMRSVFTSYVMLTPGIVDVKDMTIEIDRAKNKAIVTFTPVYEEGQETPIFKELVI